MTVYLDHHATTPCDPRVRKAMVPFLSVDFGNPSSREHGFGWKAEEAVSKAREQVASLLGVSPREVIFTSGATEAINLAVLGYCRQHKDKGRHLVVSAIEHKAVLGAAKALQNDGFEVTIVPVAEDGIVRPEAVKGALRKDTLLVALMLANNEVGTIQPTTAVGEVCAERGVAFFVDAVQGIGRVPFLQSQAQTAMAAISAHKIYGPKGVGALYVRQRPRVRLQPLVYGGGQERGLRSGTLNVPGIVGFGEACALMLKEGEAEAARLGILRDGLWRRLKDELGTEVTLNGSDQFRLTHNLNISFYGVDAEALILAVRDEVAVSSGSACTSASLEPSYVLRAMGVGEGRAHSSVRLGLGRTTTEADVDVAAGALVEAVRTLR